LLHEQARQLGGFIRSDRAGDTEHDCFAAIVAHDRTQPPAEIPLRAHDVAELLQIFFHRFTDDRVTVVAPELHLTRCVHQAQFDLLGGFRAAFRQAAAQLVEIGRHDEDVA
jgi:hypothetical protein